MSDFSSQVVLDFLPQLEAGAVLAVLPVPRIAISSPVTLLEKFKLYPRGMINLSELRVVSHPAHELENLHARLARSEFFEANNGEWMKSAFTGISVDEFNSHALLCFVTELEMPQLFSGSHDFHKNVIAEHVEQCERAMDTIRYDFCRLDLPATLPGRVGTLGIGSPFSTELFYTLQDHESYILGCELVTHLLSCGLGLEFGGDPSIQQIGNGEVGHIVRRALQMFSESLESNSESDKFVRAMSSLEFLGGGGHYLKMKKVKTEIASHCAKDKQDYGRICERLRKLTSEESGGYRTEIVHKGKRLETIIPSQSERRNLFREMQSLIGKSIASILPLSDLPWTEVQKDRASRRAELGV
jgi:hypothetical protein